ncbi:MAG: LUD domain-containing protein [Planctomycetes bacterium]|nr:LUD domain-containing protein [Planctomycetota bacterium]
MTSRDEILSAIRKHLPESTPLPDLAGPWIEYPDPIAQFASVLEMIGGRCIRVSNRAAINAELKNLPAYVTARQILSTIPDVGVPTVDLNAVDDPHVLEDIDFAILPGQFGVAENAAVWVNDEVVKHRVIYFLCQHLSLVIRAGDVLNNMHEAYQRLTFDGPRFGGFIAGPSKTADIEQSLVIGAHGPRSMTIFVVD